MLFHQLGLKVVVSELSLQGTLFEDSNGGWVRMALNVVWPLDSLCPGVQGSTAVGVESDVNV